MKNQSKDIGSLYKEAFNQYQPTPPPAAMQHVMAQPEVRQMAHWTVKWMQPVLWTAGAAMVALSAYLLWPEPENHMLTPGTELAADTPAPVLNIPLDSEPALQENETMKLAKNEPAPETQHSPAPLEKVVVNIPTDENQVLNEPSENREKELAKKEESKSPPSPAKLPNNKLSKSEPDTPSSALDRHRLQRTPRDTTPLPNVVFSETQYICKGESVSIGASGGASYSWNTGDKSQTITVKPTATSVYKVTVTRADRRKVSGEVWVNVEDCATLYVPNAFTPNNDGLNDIFKAYGKKLNAFHIQIHNATGEVLFESTDIEEGWDGTFMGHEVETGNYFYRIVYVDAQNTRYTRNGRITLLR